MKDGPIRDKEIVIMMKTISEEMQRRNDSFLKDFDLTFSQGRVLKIVYGESGKVTQKDIEDILFVSHPATRGIIKRLEEKGYIFTATDKEDKRHKVLFITEDGKAKVEAIESSVSKEKTPFDDIDDGDREDFKRILRKIIANIKQ